jgi:NADH dehydrogenase FAD-containing subunit
MARPHILVLGGNFGGLTTALSLRAELGDAVDVTVLSASDHFLFNPSLIWLPFGKRRPEDITFPLEPTFEAHGVRFRHAEATAIDLEGRKVTTADGVHGYDYLVVATGYRNDFSVAPGLGPDGPVQTITTLPDARRTADAWRAFLESPGDVLVGATQGAGCFGAAYEFLFNLTHQLRRHGLRRRVRVTFVTPEPFLGHFGMGGLPHGEQLLEMFMRKEGVEAFTGVGIERVEDGHALLTDGRRVPFAFAMLVPPFLGQKVVRATPGLSDAKGYVTVRDTYQSVGHDEVYAVGIAAAVEVPWHTALPVGIPKTGFPTEQMAHVAARNIAAQIRGEEPSAHKAFKDIPAVCVMDAGRNGVVILADKMLPPRRHGVLVPGPHAHAMKLAFEKYFLWKARHGYVGLP